MTQFITIIHVAVCLILVLVVLLQQGKKDGMGAAFGGGSQSVFGARGAETFLEKLTKVLAVIFMSTSLGLIYFSSKESTNSLFSTDKTEQAPAKTEAPAATDATKSETIDVREKPANEAAPAEKPEK